MEKTNVKEFINLYLYGFDPVGIPTDKTNKMDILAEAVYAGSEKIIADLRKWYVFYNRSITGFDAVLNTLRERVKQAEKSQEREEKRKAKNLIDEINAGKYDRLATNHYLKVVKGSDSYSYTVSFFYSLLSHHCIRMDDNKKDVEAALLRRGDALYYQKVQEAQEQKEEKARQKKEADQQAYKKGLENKEKIQKKKTWWKR